MWDRNREDMKGALGALSRKILEDFPRHMRLSGSRGMRYYAPHVPSSLQTFTPDDHEDGDDKDDDDDVDDDDDDNDNDAAAVDAVDDDDNDDNEDEDEDEDDDEDEDEDEDDNDE